MKCLFDNKWLRNLNNKGDITVQAAVNILIMLLLITFVTEMGLLGYRHSVAINSVDKMAKAIAIQSSISNNSPPPYFKEFRSTYLTLNELRDKLDVIMTKQVGAKNYTLTLVRKKPSGAVISTTNLLDSKSGVTMEYGEFFDIQLDYEIELNLLANILPGLPNAKGSAIVTSMCEYKDYLKD